MCASVAGYYITVDIRWPLYDEIWWCKKTEHIIFDVFSLVKYAWLKVMFWILMYQPRNVFTKKTCELAKFTYIQIYHIGKNIRMRHTDIKDIFFYFFVAINTMMINSKPLSILLTNKGTCMHSVCLLALIKNGMEITVTLQLFKTAIRRDKSFVCWQDDSYWKSYAWEIVMSRKSTFLAETVRYCVCMRYSAVLFFLVATNI